MKRDIGGGQSLVVASNQRRYRKFHDPWPSHAVGAFGPVIYECGSGQWVAVEVFQLAGIIQWYYPFGFYPDSDSANDAALAWTGYRNSDGLVGYMGQWWNWVGRGMVFDKVATSDWTSWLAAH
jgi:hypothetical protein